MLLIVLIIHLNVIRGHQVFGHGLEFFRVFLTRSPWFHLIRFELKYLFIDNLEVVMT